MSSSSTIDLSSSVSERFTKLNETNFLEWKENMMGLLMSKLLWEYVEEEHDAKDPKDRQAKGFIWLNIEHSQRSHVPEGANACQTWKSLCTKHEQVGPQVIANCISGLISLRYMDGTKMEDHLTKLKEYFTRLDTVDCKLPETVKAVFVLMSLPTSWTVFKQTQTAAASTSRPLTVATVTLAILQERDRRLTEEHTIDSSLESASALAVSQRAPAPGPKRKVTCTWCLKKNHEEKDCWTKQRGEPRNTNGTLNGNQAYLAAAAPPDGHYVFTAATTMADAGTWYVDSGASHHYCHEAELVKSMSPCAAPDIVSATGDRVPVKACGSVDIYVQPVKGAQGDILITLTDVYYAPGLATNLVSVSRLTAAGLDVRFCGQQCVIRHGTRIIAVADLVDSNKLYRLRTSAPPAKTSMTVARSQYSLAATGEEEQLPLPVLWHRRLGHIHHAAVAMLLSRDMTSDVRHDIRADTTPCESCVLGKHHRSAVPARAKGRRSPHPLFRIHLDICGPFSVAAHDGSRYLLQIVDDYSRYTWARCMPDRLAVTVLGYLQQFVTLAEAMHAGHRVSVLRSDNGPELVSAQFNAWLHSRGIRRERTATYSPHQNGVVERMNRAVVELGRTMLIASCLPLSFWALAMEAAAYCRNRSPTTSLDNRTPYEAWTGDKPKIAHMRIFGCLAFAHIHKHERSKLDPKAQPCIFVGYSPDSSTYRLWDKGKNRLIESRDVYFVEGQLGIKDGGPPPRHLPLLPRCHCSHGSKATSVASLSSTRWMTHLSTYLTTCLNSSRLRVMYS
jgi:transposase InsO family protein